jgi:hypothetical protein
VKENRHVDDGNLLSSEQVFWESIPTTLNSLVPLMHNYVDDHEALPPQNAVVRASRSTRGSDGVSGGDLDGEGIPW